MDAQVTMMFNYHIIGYTRLGSEREVGFAGVEFLEYGYVQCGEVMTPFVA